MSVTFPVSDVPPPHPARGRIERIAVPDAIHRLTTSACRGMIMNPDGSVSLEDSRDPSVPCEAWSEISGGVAVPQAHPLIGAIQFAFNDHLPLELSPDQVWLVLTQGFARHVLLHAEQLRHQFVAHTGTLRLEVRRDEFRKGEPDNDWPGAFEEFSSRMHEHLGKRHDLIVADFSTTGPIERAVSQLVLMESMQTYFEFGMVSMCGIPRMTLLGEARDWRSVQTRARVFREFGLGHWLDALDPILGAFVDAAEGKVDEDFWRSMYKLNDASGGPYVTGWAQVFFPYLVNTHNKTHEPNPHLDNWRSGMDAHFGGGPKTEVFPSARSSVPFDWNYFGTKFQMEFLGGFIGVDQRDDDLCVTPRLGWGVREPLIGSQGDGVVA